MLRLALLACLAAFTLAAENLSQGDINLFLSKHNAVRKATGAGLPDLTWDASLAGYSAQNSDGCKFGHTDGNLLNQRQTGENIANIMPQQTVTTAINSAVDGWAAEKSVADPPNWKCISGPCGHYSQIVWKSTTKVGCAVSQCGSMTYTVCAYKARGNFLGQTPY